MARLSKDEVNALLSIQNRLSMMAEKYDPESGQDIPLQIESNGTINSNLSCAVASLEVILQEY